MKVMKKIATMLLALCLVVPCFSMLAYAAEGKIVFSDPSTTAGQNVEVTGVVRTDGSEIGDADVNMTYDNTMVEFVSGDNVTKTADGKLTYSGKGTGDGKTELRFNVTFKALKEGTTKIEVESYKAWLYSNEAMNCTVGNSTITIAKGDGTEIPDTEEPESGEVGIEVNGVKYQLSDEFAEQDIPKGYVKIAMTFEGAERQFVQKESNGVTLGYLVDENGTGEFFLFNSEDASFSPYAEITVSETSSIILLQEDGSVKLPARYQKVDFDVEGVPVNTFKAWQDTENVGFYVIYAIDANGTETLYQYDIQDGTYQRFIQPKEEKVEKAKGILDKAVEFVKTNLPKVIVIVWAVLLVLLVLVIILGVKLHNRNAELDELYDEYDIDVEGDQEHVQAKSEKKGFFRRMADSDDDDFEDEFELEDFDEEESEKTTEETLEESEEEISDEEIDMEDEAFIGEDLESDDFEDDEEFVDDEDEFDSEDDEMFDDFEDDEMFDDDEDFEDFDIDFDDDTTQNASSYEDFDMDFIDLDD